MIAQFISLEDAGRTTAQVVQWLFGGDMPDESITLFQIMSRAIVIYIAGLVIIRIGKGRIIGRVTSLDILSGFILGSLLSRGITGLASLSGTLVASIAIVAAHWGFTWAAYRSHWFGVVFKGNALILVRDGVIIPENMRHSHISERDLMVEVRLQGIDSLKDVRLAYKERNGQISVMRKND